MRTYRIIKRGLLCLHIAPWLLAACTPYAMGTSNAVCIGPKWTSFLIAAFIQLPVLETTPLPCRCFIQNGKTFNECAGLSVGLAPCHSIRIRMQYRTISSQPWVFFTELEFKTGKFFSNHQGTELLRHFMICAFANSDFWIMRFFLGQTVEEGKKSAVTSRTRVFSRILLNLA